MLETLHKDFESVSIINVKVHRDVDFDGDDVLRIDVVFEGRPRDMGRLVSGAVRHVRPRLKEEFNEFAFPLMSFISSRDAGRLNFEPA